MAQVINENLKIINSSEIFKPIYHNSSYVLLFGKRRF